MSIRLLPSAPSAITPSINPVGFGLENYDAVGQYRTTENGYDVDATGTLVGTEGEAPFTDGVQLAKTIAASPEARLCYAANWFRYTFGRTEEDSDGCALSAIAGIARRRCIPCHAGAHRHDSHQGFSLSRTGGPLALDRRNFLRGVGGSAVGLPFLESFAPRSAMAERRRPNVSRCSSAATAST